MLASYTFKLDDISRVENLKDSPVLHRTGKKAVSSYQRRRGANLFNLQPILLHKGVSNSHRVPRLFRHQDFHVDSGDRFDVRKVSPA